MVENRDTGIKLKNIDKAYGESVILKDFNMDFEEGRVTAILGPSGCGKTTLLNIIAGLEKVQGGRVEGLEGKTLACVFQEDRLIPWYSVYDNINFVIKSEDHEGSGPHRIREYLQMVGLLEYSHYYPKELSGGMKRRVSLARALAYGGDILLMDEPFKGLDRELRKDIIHLISRIQKEDKKTIIFVTHDIEEVKSLAHNVYILEGRPLKLVA